MKKIAFIIALLVATFTFAYAAQDVIEVQLDGTMVNFTDAQGNTANPQIINNRTMVPMRKIFEVFNANVDWDDSTKTVTATTADKEIKLTIDNATPVVKDIKTGKETTITLDQAPVIRENRTLVPVRFIAESLNKEVAWDATNRVVVVIDFDKITDRVEKEIPNLKYLFDLNLKEMNSFVSDSKITGGLKYNNAQTNELEELKADGTIKLSFASMDELRGDIKLDIEGKGTLYNSLDEAGFSNLEAGIVLSNGKIYLGVKSGDQMKWQDASSELPQTQITTTLTAKNKIGSYEDFTNELKTSLGTINKDSYVTLNTIVDFLVQALGGDNIKRTENGSKETVVVKLDIGKFLASALSSATTGFSIKDLSIDMELTLDNKVITSDKTRFLANITNSQNENIDADITVTSTYSSVNEAVKVEVPTL